MGVNGAEIIEVHVADRGVAEGIAVDLYRERHGGNHLGRVVGRTERASRSRPWRVNVVEYVPPR